MINELYVEKLIKLIRQKVVTPDDIKIQEYKAEVESRLATQ